MQLIIKNDKIHLRYQSSSKIVTKSLRLKATKQNLKYAQTTLLPIFVRLYAVSNTPPSPISTKRTKSAKKSNFTTNFIIKFALHLKFNAKFKIKSHAKFRPKFSPNSSLKSIRQSLPKITRQNRLKLQTIHTTNRPLRLSLTTKFHQHPPHLITSS